MSYDKPKKEVKFRWKLLIILAILGFVVGVIIIPVIAFMITLIELAPTGGADNFPEAELMTTAMFWSMAGMLISFIPPGAYTIHYIVKRRKES